MRRLILAAALALGLLIPTVAVSAAPCGPDPHFGYRTNAGYAAAVDLLLDHKAAEDRGTYYYVNPQVATGLLSFDELVIATGAGIFGDSISNPFNLPAGAFAAFSGIIGVDGLYYAVQAGKIVEGRVSLDRVQQLYEEGWGFPTLPGIPCA